MPKRIQRKRMKGWRMPENTVYVGRGSKWGNPFRLISGVTREQIWNAYRDFFLKPSIKFGYLDLKELRGKDLACWCKETELCHGDILLRLANSDLAISDSARPL